MYSPEKNKNAEQEQLIIKIMDSLGVVPLTTKKQCQSIVLLFLVILNQMYDCELMKAQGRHFRKWGQNTNILYRVPLKTL